MTFRIPKLCYHTDVLSQDVIIVLLLSSLLLYQAALFTSTDLVLPSPGSTSSKHLRDALVRSPCTPWLLLPPRWPGRGARAAVHDSGQEADPAENSPARREARRGLGFPLLLLLSHTLLSAASTSDGAITSCAVLGRQSGNVR